MIFPFSFVNFMLYYYYNVVCQIFVIFIAKDERYNLVICYFSSYSGPCLVLVWLLDFLEPLFLR